MTEACRGDVVVVDVGGTKTRTGSVRHGVPASEFETFPSNRFDVERPADVLAEAIEAHVALHALSLSAVIVGIPGMLDQRRRTITHCNNVRAFEGDDLGVGLQKHLGVPVQLEQDIMLQLLGEWRGGVARGSDSVFGVYFGTGIGSAWLQAGNPFRDRAACLQAGHVPMGIEGVRCPCGNTDCVEAYASGHVLETLAREHGMSVSEVFRQTRSTELAAALERFVNYQACLLATIITLLEPDTMVVGGGIPAMDGYPREKLIAVARHHLQKPRPAKDQKFAFAMLSELAPLFGAIALLENSSSSLYIIQS